MTTLELVINKYSNSSPKISFEEFIEDINNFIPMFIPIMDISIITTLGTYLNNLIIYHKWKICPDIKCDITNMIQKYSEQNDNIFADIKQ